MRSTAEGGTGSKCSHFVTQVPDVEAEYPIEKKVTKKKRKNKHFSRGSKSKDTDSLNVL